MLNFSYFENHPEILCSSFNSLNCIEFFYKNSSGINITIFLEQLGADFKISNLKFGGYKI